MSQQGQPGGHQGNQVARQQRYNQMRGQQQMNRGSMQQGANTRGAMQGNRGGMNQGRGGLQQGGQQQRYYNNRNPNFNPNYRGNNRGNMGNRGGRGGPMMNRRNGQIANQGRNNHKLTFEKDFDFDENNKLFNKEDMAKELKKSLNITGKDKDKKKEEGSEASTEEGEESVEKKEEEKKFYDKSKPFFDKITCETSNPRGERMSYGEERRKNNETFGTQYNRGGYHGNRR